MVQPLFSGYILTFWSPESMSSADKQKTKRELLRDLKIMKNKLSKERKKSSRLQKMVNKLTSTSIVVLIFDLRIL